jgi:hypothetical protein
MKDLPELGSPDILCFCSPQMSKERMPMKRVFAWMVCAVAVAVLLVPAFPQGNRGKAELTAGGGKIVVDYGRPSLKGRDMLSQLKDGDFWRMGSNQATTLTTPADLMLGATKIAKGSYSLWLTKSGESFELVFNSQTGQWGTQHDKSKDVAKAAMKKEAVSNPVETLAIDLAQAPGGGTFTLSWGTTKLAANFEIGK